MMMGRNAAAGGAVVAVDVAAADAAGGDANEHFAGAGLRLGKIGEFELQIFFEEEGFHRGSLKDARRAHKIRFYNSREQRDRKYGWG